MAFGILHPFQFLSLGNARCAVCEKPVKGPLKTAADGAKPLAFANAEYVRRDKCLPACLVRVARGEPLQLSNVPYTIQLPSHYLARLEFPHRPLLYGALIRATSVCSSKPCSNNYPHGSWLKIISICCVYRGSRRLLVSHYLPLDSHLYRKQRPHQTVWYTNTFSSFHSSYSDSCSSRGWHLIIHWFTSCTSCLTESTHSPFRARRFTQLFLHCPASQRPKCGSMDRGKWLLASQSPAAYSYRFD